MTRQFSILVRLFLIVAAVSLAGAALADLKKLWQSPRAMAKRNDIGPSSSLNEKLLVRKRRQIVNPLVASAAMTANFQAMNGVGLLGNSPLIGAQPGVGLGMMGGGIDPTMALLGGGYGGYGGIGGYGGYGGYGMMGGYGSAAALGTGGLLNSAGGANGIIVGNTMGGSPCSRLCTLHINCKLSCVSPVATCNCIFPTNCNCADYQRR